MIHLFPVLSKGESDGESQTIAFTGYFAATVGLTDSLIYFISPGGPLDILS